MFKVAADFLPSGVSLTSQCGAKAHSNHTVGPRTVPGTWKPLPWALPWALGRPFHLELWPEARKFADDNRGHMDELGGGSDPPHAATGAAAMSGSSYDPAPEDHDAPCAESPDPETPELESVFC